MATPIRRTFALSMVGSGGGMTFYQATPNIPFPFRITELNMCWYGLDAVSAFYAAVFSDTPASLTQFASAQSILQASHQPAGAATSPWLNVGGQGVLHMPLQFDWFQPNCKIGFAVNVPGAAAGSLQLAVTIEELDIDGV